MSLIPWEELATLMAGEGFGPLSPAEEERVDRLVQQGYETWRDADAEFRQRAARLRNVERGRATEEDLEAWLVGPGGARRESGWSRKVLTSVEGEREPRLLLTEARVYRLPDGKLGFVGRDAGLGLSGPSAEQPRRLGLNQPAVAARIRDAFADDAGAGSRIPAGSLAFTLVDPAGFTAWCERNGMGAYAGDGVVACMYCVRRLDLAHVPPREVTATMSAYVASADGERSVELAPDELAAMVRLVRAPRPKRNRPANLHRDRLLAIEGSWVSALRTPRKGEPVAAVFPLAALWLQPAPNSDPERT